jgi:hypothetical protein
MTPKMQDMDIYLMPTHALYFPIQYLPIVHHCRIYLGLFLWKYRKIGVFTPGFSPRGDLNDPKDARYGYMPYADTRIVLPDTLSNNSSLLSNLFRSFFLKIPFKWAYMLYELKVAMYPNTLFPAQMRKLVNFSSHRKILFVGKKYLMKQYAKRCFFEISTP